MSRQALSPVRQYLLGFGLIFMALLMALVAVFWLAISPEVRAKDQLTDWATHYAKLTEVGGFTSFRGDATYYSIAGLDDTNQPIRLLWRTDQTQPELVALSQGLSQDQLAAVAQKEGIEQLEEVSLGRYQDQLVWEVASQGSYYLFDFKTGKLLRVLS